MVTIRILINQTKYFWIKCVVTPDWHRVREAYCSVAHGSCDVGMQEFISFLESSSTLHEGLVIFVPRVDCFPADLLGSGLLFPGDIMLLEGSCDGLGCLCVHRVLRFPDTLSRLDQNILGCVGLLDLLSERIEDSMKLAVQLLLSNNVLLF